MTALPLVAENVVKRYGTRTVLGGATLKVDRGELVIIRGPNGTGKSTLLGCICGQVVPDDGRIAIDGHDLRSDPLGARRRLRALAQIAEAPAGVTGRDWLALHADVFDDRNAPDRFADEPLKEVLDQLATTYSVGLRRRLGFAALQLGEAALHVLDEPFAGVDRDGRATMIDRIASHLKNGAGVLVAAHDHELADLAQMSPRVVDLSALVVRG
ncbi:MAG TPA: ATP-binding cassette domain-containing protein [Nannocystaceae bacterium]|nr:ATP-binding cassette domain-containing protein [Nannocystaceae bacterium]